ncbi:MAG: hypothetical protein N3D73_01320 [Candidatus Diapherotrites archaeon]|nr:hypothetical protein [Candidatus Diapherotrites archaeon]
MLKRIILLFFLVQISFSGFSIITVLSPVEENLLNNESITIGSVQQGECFEVIVAREGLRKQYWDDVIVSLPNDKWKYEYKVEDKTISVDVCVKKEEAENIYNIGILLIDNEAVMPKEKVNIKVKVEENLINFKVIKTTEVGEVGKPINYKIIVENKSIASHKILINSDLSKAWFTEVIFEAPPKSKRELNVSITPRAAGYKKFNFKFDSLINGKELSRKDTEIKINPSLLSKLSSAAYSLPLFDIVTLPQRLIVSALFVK